MAGLEGLIFDVDGTLAENEQCGHRVAFNRAFEDLSLAWRWDEALYLRLLEVFGGKERLRYFFDEFLPADERPDDPDTLIPRLHRRKTERYIELLQAGRIPLRPGVARLIREARAAGLRLAVASTTTQENVTTLLARWLGPESVGWFDAYACGDVVPNKKPAPDVYLHALDEMNLDADQCLAIEDSESGLASALAAGLPTVVTLNPVTRNQDFSGALIVLDSLGEPGQPFTVLAGDAGKSRWVDVALLRRLHGQCLEGD